MDTIKDQLSFYSSALQLRGKRNNILASNIANAATPNYKARDISFEDEIKKFDILNDNICYVTINNLIKCWQYLQMNEQVYNITIPLSDLIADVNDF
jgi:flagellar basal-body rod protein FlgB